MCCGPEWLPDLLRGHYFTDECCEHDKNYEAGMDRKLADKIFLESMLAKSDRWFRKGQAYFFYIMVRLFGWISYTRSK